jgi:hypothetical protein
MFAYLQQFPAANACVLLLSVALLQTMGLPMPFGQPS